MAIPQPFRASDINALLNEVGRAWLTFKLLPYRITASKFGKWFLFWLTDPTSLR